MMNFSGVLSKFLSQVLDRLTCKRRTRRLQRWGVPAVVQELEFRQMLSGAGLIINPTFDSTIISDPKAATIEATINQVIAEYEAHFSNPITVNITFQKITSGLGGSNWPSMTLGYSWFRTQLALNAVTNNDSAQLAELAFLPNTLTDPVLGQSFMNIKTANLKALAPYVDPSSDGTVYINTSICNLDRTTITPSKYDLASVAAHEIDEILGLGSALDPSDGFTQILPEDLVRYDQNGNRSYTTSSSAHAYLSLNGTTDLAQFNQTGHGADYGDWAMGSTHLVQDAFGTPRVILDPGTPEFMALDAIGYNYVASINHAPVGTSNTVTMLENTAYTFTTSDFGFSDPNDTPANNLKAVEITTLPLAGTLTDNGVAVTAGQFVSVADISSGKLVFTPAMYANGTNDASFTFQVQDDGGTSNGGVDNDPTPKTMTVNFIAVSQAPLGTSNTVTTLENSAYTFANIDFGFSDPNDSPANTLMAVEITTLPLAGNLTDNGVAVTAAQFVAVADIASGKLVFNPANDANGTDYASFTFQVQDNGSTSNGGVTVDPSAKTMTVNITAVSQAPVGTSNTVMTLENTPYTFATADFGFSDPNDSPPNTLTAVEITTLPSAGTLTDNGTALTAAQFVAVADITSGKLVFTPANYANGTDYASFTFQVQDNGSTSNGGVTVDPSAKTMSVSVTAVSQAPVGTSNTVTTLENSAYTFATTDFGFSDPNDSPANTLMAVEITTLPGAGILTDNGVAVTAAQFVAVADVTSGKLVFAPATYANGTNYASFTFQVQDNGSTSNGGATVDPSAKTMTVNVTAVSQAPVGTSNTVTTLENTAYIFATSDFGFSDPNDTPANTLTAVEITTLPSAGTLTDNGAALTATQIVAVADITSGKLVFAPVTFANGTDYANFTFQVQDNGSTSNGGVTVDPSAKTMSVSVTAVSQAPVGTSNTVTTLENSAYTFATTDFGFSDPHDSPANSLKAVQISTLPLAGILSDNGASVTAGQFVPVADVSAGKLVFTPATNVFATGYASFTFQVQDDGSTLNAGATVDPSAKTMTVNVSPPPPQVTAPATANVNENASLTFSTAKGNAISVLDVAAVASSDTLKLTVTNGKLVLGSTTGLTFTSGANNSAAMTIWGTLANINAALNGLVFTPTAGYSGAASLALTAKNGRDNLTGLANVAITVDAVAPTVTAPATASVNANSSLTFWTGNGNAISVQDVAAVGVSDTLKLTVTNGKLVLGSTAGLTFTSGANGSASMTIWGTLANINAAVSGLVFTPTTGYSGSASLALTAKNGRDNLTGSANIAITVNSVAPTVTAPTTAGVIENSSLTFSTGNGNAIGVQDVAAVGVSDTLTLTATHGKLVLGSTTGLTFTSGANGSASMTIWGTLANINAALSDLKFTPTAGYIGSASLTLTAKNGRDSLTGSASVAITVNSA